METGKEEVSVRKVTRGEKLQIAFLILLLVAIAVLIICIITILKYKDLINNPIAENLKKFEIDSCRCLNNQGKYIDIYSEEPMITNSDPTYFNFTSNGSK